MTRKIGALWQKKSQEGKVFLSGVLNDLRGDIYIAVFKNDRKESDNQPDYNIVLSERQEQKPKQENDEFFGPAGEQTEEKVANEEINVENIPF